LRLRRAESALKRAIASNQVETAERAWKPAGLPPHVEEHVAQEILGDGFVADEAAEASGRRGCDTGQTGVCIASRSPPAMRAINISSEEGSPAAWQAQRQRIPGGQMRSTWNFPFSHVPHNQVGRGKSVH
jgi:hypothetical protein